MEEETPNLNSESASLWIRDVLVRFRDYNQSTKFKNENQDFFPIFKKKQIQTLCNMATHGKSIFDIITTISHCFQFEQIQIMNLTQEKIENSKKRLILISNTISWIGIKISKTTQTEFHLLFSTLINCLSSDFSADYLNCLFLILTQYKKEQSYSIETDEIRKFCKTINSNLTNLNESLNVILESLLLGNPL